MSNGDASPLFAAKLSPPRLRAPSVRADQLARLAAARQAKLLLVRAPAGYGKTTLVAAGAHELGWQCVWYRVDSLDANPSRFLSGLTHALRESLPALGDSLLERIEEPGERVPTAATVALLAGELRNAVREDLFIVLDDYETLAGAAGFNEALAALLDYLPPALHLLVLSRVRPTFPTAKMTLQGDLVEITHLDLRFDRGQVASVAERQSGVSPTEAGVEALLRLTEGWAAGVLLAGKATRWLDPARMDEALTGGDLEREVFPYLAEQVYARQSPRMRRFLKDTSCLESMTAVLAEAVTGTRDTAGLLARLERDEVFTFTDPAGGAYRYHPLLRRFLQERLVLEAGCEALVDLQRRTAAALAGHGMASAAVELYLVARDTTAAITLLGERGHDLLDDCGETLLSHWIAALRREESPSPGWAALLEGRRSFLLGDLTSARRQLAVALQSLNGDRAGRYLALGQLANCCYFAGAEDEAIDHIRQALALAADLRERAECLATLAGALTPVCRWQELDEARAAFDACGTVPAKLAAQMAVAEISRAHAAGDNRTALAAVQKTLPEMRRHGTYRAAANVLYGHAYLSLLVGDYAQATRFLEESQKLCDAHPATDVGTSIKVVRAYLLAQEGQLDACYAELDEALQSPFSQANVAMEFEIQYCRATVLRRAGELERASQAYESARALYQIGVSPDGLNAEIDLAFVDGLSGAGRQASKRLSELRDKATGSELRFHEIKADFFRGVLAVRDGSRAPSELGPSCAELLRLGHIDFIGQELVASPEAAGWLPTADLDDAALREVLRAIALQPGGPHVLASLAGYGDRIAALVLDTVRAALPAKQAERLLQELRRHPAKIVRDRARHLSSGARAAERLVPELTRREEEILALLAEGRSNEEIAKRLVIATATVKTHVHRILTKTGAGGRLAAATLYRQRVETPVAGGAQGTRTSRTSAPPTRTP